VSLPCGLLKVVTFPRADCYERALSQYAASDKVACMPSDHRSCRGQASVEVVALLPLLGVLLGVLWQAAVAGQAVWLAGSAARAAARATALGSDAPAAARRVLPERLERGLVIRRLGPDEGVRVAIAVPAVLGGGRLITVSASALLQHQGRP
jgi:hypothetical protein